MNLQIIDLHVIQHRSRERLIHYTAKPGGIDDARVRVSSPINTAANMTVTLRHTIIPTE